MKFVVSSIIDKLPFSWRDVKKTLKHKEKDIDVNQLGTHLQIEVSIRVQESGGSRNPNISSIDMVEESSHKKEKRKGQYGNSTQKGKAAKTTPLEKSCWICGKLGHQKKDCYIHKCRKENRLSTSDPNMKGTTSEGDLGFGF